MHHTDPADNRHLPCCHIPFQQEIGRWNSNFVVKDLSMFTRPRSGKYNHRSDEQQQRPKSSKPTLRERTPPAAFGTPQRIAGHLTPRSLCATRSPDLRKEKAQLNDDQHVYASYDSRKAARLNQVNSLHGCKILSMHQGTTLRNAVLQLRWCNNLQKDLENLALQAPFLEQLQIHVSDPQDHRWLPQSPVLDMATCSAARMPCLTQLHLTGVPIPELSFSGLALPKLRHLKVSNAGFCLNRPPHTNLTVTSFEHLQALEVIELVVREPVPLGQLANCSPVLRVLHLAEFWSVSNQQERHHRLVLPACRVLVIRDALSAVSLDLWAPCLRELQLLIPRLLHLNIGPGGDYHRDKHRPKPDAQRLPTALVTLLPGILSSDAIKGLLSHTQVKAIEFDDVTLREQITIRERIEASLKLQKGAAEIPTAHIADRTEIG